MLAAALWKALAAVVAACVALWVEGIIMWLVYAREPESDAPWWPGRRLLAAVDAVGWPLLWIELLANAPAPLGVVKPVVTAIALVYAIARLRRAVFVNHRYQLTTLWLGRVFAVLLLVGFILKLMMPG